MRNIFFIIFFGASQLCIGQTFKLGAFGSFHRDIIGYAHLSDPMANTGENIVYRQKAGIRASYSPWHKISLEAGVFISSSTFDDDVRVYEKFVVAQYKYFPFNNDNLALDSHKLTSVGPSIGILFKTNKHKGCVTFVTLNYSRSYTIQEVEKFVQYTQGETINTNPSETYSNSQSKFEFNGSEIDFSFGAYWFIENFDGEIRLEPKFNIYRTYASNSINTAPDITLIHEDDRIYGSMGFEISVNKNIRKRKDIGRNKSSIW